MKQQRMTKQKQIVLNVTMSHHDHPTADQIYLEVREIDTKISRGTVYRNLDQLSDTGKILQIKVPGASRFDCRTDLHFHTICKNCGQVCDAPLEYQHELDDFIFKKTGFKVERHRTVFEGLCSDCIEKSEK